MSKTEGAYHGFFDDPGIPWEQRLATVVETMRDISQHTDPQAMVRAYGQRMAKLLPTDRMVSLSRRDLAAPHYRITRSSLWKEPINPWTEKERLPVMEGGLLGELLYGEQPRIIDDLHVSPDDPGAEYFAGQRSLIAIPQYDHGLAMNMMVLMREQPHAYATDRFPELVWMHGMFGRATHSLVLAQELQAANEKMDHEMKTVEEIQRSLLPAKLPRIPTLDLAAYYETSARAGGDYYDLFPLPDGQWGILIADVSGHGTPAAVLMAITHSIAHTYPGPPTPAGQILNFVNRHLATRYTHSSDTFVTAFYGIYDPATRIIRYACAGHNPPRLRSCLDGVATSLDGDPRFPLGVLESENYEDYTRVLRPGDQLIFYTDGITDAHNPAGELFGTARLDAVLTGCGDKPEKIVEAVLAAVELFTAGAPATDDRTLLAARVT